MFANCSFTFQESDSEVEGLDDVEEDVEEEHENEREASVQEEPEPVVKKPSELSVHKDTERQLSKKELKKKGLEELDAVLAELGYPTKDTGGSDESCGNLLIYAYLFCVSILAMATFLDAVILRLISLQKNMRQILTVDKNRYVSTMLICFHKN